MAAKNIIIGKINAYPVDGGLNLTFMQYDEEQNIAVTDNWYGQYANLNALIYQLFGTKPVEITINKVT